MEGRRPFPSISSGVFHSTRYDAGRALFNVSRIQRAVANESGGLSAV